jgi:hypothetical protein
MLPLISPLLRPLFPSRPLRACVRCGCGIAVLCRVSPWEPLAAPLRAGNATGRRVQRQSSASSHHGMPYKWLGHSACVQPARSRRVTPSVGDRADEKCRRWSKAAHGPLSAAAASSRSLLLSLASRQIRKSNAP